MSQQHKDALAKGRKEARAITAYLETLGPRKRGRPVTEASVRKRLERVRQQVRAERNPLRRVELAQQRLDLEAALEELRAGQDTSALEKGFIRFAASYSERKGITYAAWREAGVPPAVLAKAGIKRG